MARQDSAQGNDFFDPGVPEGNLPDFTRSSRGYESSASGIATAIKGTGDLINMGATGLDNAYKKRIRDEITDLTDTIRDAHINDLTKIKNAMGTPKELDAQLMRLQILGEARATGRVSDTQYYTQLDIMSRGMRAKYPGYREHIDNVVKDLTGVDPANKVIAELRSEIASRVDPTEKEYNNLVTWAVKEGHLPADFHSRKNTNKPYSLDELQLAVARETRINSDLKLRSQMLAYNKDQKQNVEMEAEGLARDGLNKLGNGLLSNSVGGMGASFKDLEQMALKASQGQVSEQERQQLSLSFNSFQSSWMKSARDYLYNKPIDNKGTTFASILPQAKLEAIMKGHEDTLNFIKDSLFNKDYGSILALKRNNDLVEAGVTNEILKNSSAARILQSSRNIFGPELSLQIFRDNSKLLTDVGKNLHALSVGMASQGESLSEVLNTVKKSGTDVQTSRQIIDTVTQLIVDPKASKEAKVNLVKSLYGSGNQSILSKVDEGSRLMLYSKLTSPQIASKILELRQTGDEASWNRYTEFVKESFLTLFKKEANDVQNLIVNRSNLDAKWNKATGQFEVFNRVPTDSPKLSSGANSLANAADSFFMDNRARKSVETINAQLRGIIPILRADQGQNADEAISRLIRSANINVNANKQPTGLVNLMELLADVISKASAADQEVNKKLKTND